MIAVIVRSKHVATDLLTVLGYHVDVQSPDELVGFDAQDVEARQDGRCPDYKVSGRYGREGEVADLSADLRLVLCGEVALRFG